MVHEEEEARGSLLFHLHTPGGLPRLAAGGVALLVAEVAGTAADTAGTAGSRLLQDLHSLLGWGMQACK